MPGPVQVSRHVRRRPRVGMPAPHLVPTSVKTQLKNAKRTLKEARRELKRAQDEAKSDVEEARSAFRKAKVDVSDAKEVVRRFKRGETTPAAPVVRLKDDEEPTVKMSPRAPPDIRAALTRRRP